MTKKKRRIWWLDIWNIEEQESWLTDMSRKGWKLTKVGQLFATFEQIEPQELNYRCEVFKWNNRHEQNRKSFYEEAGWEYVGSRQHVHIFREVVNTISTEIHTEPIEQAASLTILRSSLQTRAWTTLILSAIIILVQILTFQHDNVRYFTDESFIPSLMFIPYIIFTNLYMMFGRIHLTRMFRRLESGELLNHDVHYKRVLNRNKAIGYSLIILFVIFISFLVPDIVKIGSQDRYPDIPNEEIPIIQMADIINESTFTPISQGDYINFYRVESNILVPKQYELHQNVEVPEKTWEDKSSIYDPFLQSYGYEVRNEWFAERLVQSLLADNTETFKSYVYQRNSVVDELWFWQDDSHFDYIIRDGKMVYRVVYYGMESMEEVLKQNLAILPG
ncbi:DUF2812 domain-containing protein [Ornithinibacillus salinisoli]|uniref:DUF2812 domain-containing protein n=1 Tax=Ornithinibacillus salinisoli TaxID=1848459 RepID=A0ABW4VUB5_9BACI